ncbi:hypothetical protein K1T71_007537 [Dendrolimus kikuchii]|uniref:Uncharacterized protein n=1 Tax=Dendrolimus kikuchii TaxID=765133 RepID=A0ACC1CXH7_9NEOP|nr:hypothetical protein K1T71_007537 [Dendrolimus kikuchii]
MKASGISIKRHYTILGLKSFEDDEDISYCGPNLFDGGNGDGGRRSSPPCHQLRIRTRPRRHNAKNATKRPGLRKMKIPAIAALIFLTVEMVMGAEGPALPATSPAFEQDHDGTALMMLLEDLVLAYTQHVMDDRGEIYGPNGNCPSDKRPVRNNQGLVIACVKKSQIVYD